MILNFMICYILQKILILFDIELLRSAVTIPCILMAWNPFRETKTCSSSLDIPRIGIRVPSIAPTTFGKSATFIKSDFTLTRSVGSDGE